MPSCIEGNKTNGKLIAILEIFLQEGRALSLSELVAASGLPRASLYRILNPLIKEDYFFLDSATRLYGPGTKLQHLGKLAQSLRSLDSLFPEILGRANTESLHTVLLARLSGGQVMYTHKKEKAEGLKISLRLGVPHPAGHGVLGRVILAHQPEESAKQLLENNPPESWQQGPWPGWQQSVSLLRDIRAAGFSCGRGEQDPETMALGAPVYDENGRVGMALGMLVPRVLLSEAELARCQEIICRYAAELSSTIGYRLRV